MNTTETISLLNYTMKVKLAPSPIHGVGVFALRDIKKGERVYAGGMEPNWYTLPFKYCEKLFPEVKQALLERFPCIRNGVEFFYPDVIALSYMNHSDTPNYKDDIALTDIKAGEEITEDYRTMPNYKDIYPFLA